MRWLGSRRCKSGDLLLQNSLGVHISACAPPHSYHDYSKVNWLRCCCCCSDYNGPFIHSLRGMHRTSAAHKQEAKQIANNTDWSNTFTRKNSYLVGRSPYLTRMVQPLRGSCHGLTTDRRHIMSALQFVKIYL